MKLAASLDIIVEVTLFSSIYKRMNIWEMNHKTPKIVWAAESQLGSQIDIPKKCAASLTQKRMFGISQMSLKLALIIFL